MLPGDRLICTLVEPKNIGFTFKDWLLHVTIVPWFRLGKSSAKIADDLNSDLRSIGSFSVSTGRPNMGFGHQRGKMATLVQLPSPITEIEKIIRGYFHGQHAWLVDETTTRHRAFRPHITNQKSISIHEGDVFTCDKLHIVEQKGGYKEIVGEVSLGIE